MLEQLESIFTSFSYAEKVIFENYDSFRTVFIGLAFVLGASFGSFMQACAHRIPIGLSIVYPNSYCPQCKHKLSFTGNFPILGWLSLRGKCEFCRQKIPIIYLIAEIVLGLMSVLLWTYHIEYEQNIVQYICSFTFMCWMYLLSSIDYKNHILPDPLTLFPLLLFLYYRPLEPTVNIGQTTMVLNLIFLMFLPGIVTISILRVTGVFTGLKFIDYMALVMRKCKLLHKETELPSLWVYPIIYVVVYLAMFGLDFKLLNTHSYEGIRGFLIAIILLYGSGKIVSVFTKTEAMGIGDIKLAATLGFFLGPFKLLVVLGIASLIGGIFGFYSFLKGGNKQIAFGPYIALAAFLVYEVSTQYEIGPFMRSIGVML